MKKFYFTFLCAILCANSVFADVFTAGQRVCFTTEFDWTIANAVISACFRNSDSDETFSAVATSLGNNTYYVIVPGAGTFSAVTFVRFQDGSTPSWSAGVWNRSPWWPSAEAGKIYNITNSDKDNPSGSWGAYIAWNGAPKLNINLEHGHSASNLELSPEFNGFTMNGDYNVNNPAHANLKNITDGNGDNYLTNYSNFTDYTKYFKLGGTAKTNIPAAQVFLKYRLYVAVTGARENTPTANNSIELEYNGTDNWTADAVFDILAEENRNYGRKIIGYHPYDVEFWFETTYNGITTHYSNDGKNYWFRFDTNPFPIDESTITVAINNGASTEYDVEDIDEENFIDVTKFEVGGSCHVNDFYTTMGVATADEVTVKMNYKISNNNGASYNWSGFFPMIADEESDVPEWTNFATGSMEDMVSSLPEGTYLIHFWYSAEIDNLTVYDSNAEGLNEGVNYRVTVQRTITGTPYIAEIHTNIYTNNSELIATFADAQQVNVYDLNGKTIDSQIAVNQYRKTLPQGIYIVKVGSETQKIIVK
ncbi:MAG: T9SS type A sorting domain-containing protein [Prevotellaceae bacterium]|nr:T9SS type A sorting domain-containing protein [Prevotellaceae bacterium]